MQTLEQFEALKSPTGQRLLVRLAATDPAENELLTLGSALRRDYPGEMVAAAMTLHELRRRAAAKFSRASEMWFTRAGYEQATSEISARHRAVRFAVFSRTADFCCGIGGDLIGLAGVTEVLAVDRDPLHLALARQNAAVYGAGERIATLEADVTTLDLNEVGAVFVDPARRSERGRLGANRSEPPLDWCFELPRRVPAVAVKSAPGIEHALVPAGWEIELVAEGRMLKEATLWSPALATTPRRATLLPGGETLIAAPGDPVMVVEPGEYLLDPNPAVTRAGLVEELARLLGASKIDERIAFLTTDRPVVTPWARTLRVVASLPWRIKAIGAELRTREIGVVDIRRRGLAGDVEAIRKQLKLRGEGRAMVAMTRFRNQPWCVIAVELDEAKSFRSQASNGSASSEIPL